jgi:autotransporter-associated beta strand protein
LVVGGSTSGTFSGVINNGSGVIGLTKSGAGTLLLTGSNGFTGGAALNGGTLGVGSANALGSSGTISFGGGTLQYSASNTTDYSGRFSNAASQQYSIDTNGQNVTLGSNLTSSGGSFTKLGSGSVTLSGSNSTSGGTTVSAGGLRLNGSIAGGLNVAAIASLSGTGTVGGSATIAGTHSPGNSPGTQTFNGGLTYEAGALVNWELIANTTGTAGVNYDQIIMPSGNLTFSGSTTLALSFSGDGSTVNWSDSFWNVNRSWMVYDLSGGTTTNLTNLIVGGSLLDSANNPLSPTARGYFTTSLSGQDVMLNFVAVPEPATWAMALTGLAAGGLMIRRRRRS